MLTKMNNTKKWATIGAVSLIMSACATAYKPSEKLQTLETQYNSLVQQEFIEQYAPVALKEADESIKKVEKLEKDKDDKETIAHYQYLAQKKLDTAYAVAKQKRADANIGNADVNRKDALLSAKEREVEAAKENAEQLQMRVDNAESEVARAQADAKAMAEKASAMAKTLEDISARESERGLVLTMGSILFELNKSSLKPGAERTLSRVAEFLKQYPGRSVLVEGFTDSMGSDSYNQNLSEQRAEAVVAFLAHNGVESSRLTSKGYGESYPIANNATESGRQQNRRVELVIANEDKRPVQAR